jgi:putative ABC transport system permease protein
MRYLHPRFLARQLTGSGFQAGIFVMGVALAIALLLALDGFSRNLRQTVLADARTIQGGDVVLHAHREFTPGLREAVRRLEAQGRVRAVAVTEFYSMVRPEQGEASLLADIKIPGEGYPLFGQVRLASGAPFRERLGPGRAVAERRLLERLSLRVGDGIRVGERTLTLADEVVAEPDRPVNLFSLGPRLFVHADDVAALELLKKGSRVEHRLLLGVGPGEDGEAMATGLRESAAEGERVSGFRTGRTGVTRFLDNFLFFLRMLGVFSLLLAGIGIQSTMAAFLGEKRETVAILSVLGATGRFVLTHYLAVVALLGLVGTAVGILAAWGLEHALLFLFRGILPGKVEAGLSFRSVLQGCLLGGISTLLFTSVPLSRLGEIRPLAILHRERAPRIHGRRRFLFALLLTLLLVGLVFWQVGDRRTALLFAVGTAGLVILTAAGAAAATALFGRLRVRSLVLRQALRGLLRPGNATVWVITTLGASLTVILTLVLLQGNLEDSYIRSFPPDAPNLYFLDIQPHQRDGFDSLGEGRMEIHPVVVGTVRMVDGRPVDRERERQRPRDNLGREFYLSYRDGLLGDERLTQGAALFDGGGDPQVSVLEEVLEMAPLEVGSRIVFAVGGVEISARVSSLRKRTSTAPGPFFYFIFPPDLLKEAPRTFFAAARVPPAGVVDLQNRVAARFPNVSVVDVTEAARSVGDLIRKMSRIVRFSSAFGVGAGLLILLGSTLATRRDRIRECVYYKVLGATRRFVLSIFAAEHLVVGLAGSLLAILLSLAATWYLTTVRLQIPFRPYPGVVLVTVAGSMLLTMATGLLPSLPLLGARPAEVLKERTE